MNRQSGNDLSRPANRREFLGSSMLAALAVAGCAPRRQVQTPNAGKSEPGLRTAPSQSIGQPHAESTAVRGPLPSAQLGRLSISRLIAGGNLLSGWCHARDLRFVRRLAGAYLTEAKQFDTLEWMEQAGINCIMIDMVQLPLVNKYKLQRGGRIRTIVAVREDWGAWTTPNVNSLQTHIAQVVDQGADMLFLHGGYCDRLVQTGKPDCVEFLGQALDLIRRKGSPAGLGSHALEVPVECQRRGILPDYYVKTFHHDKYWSATPRDRRKRFCVDGPFSLDHNEFHDNIFCIDPEDTAAFMLNNPKPWIAFKVLAGGAIHPQSGFSYAFENGADFLAVGMFDFEIAEDVSIVRQVLASVRRQRPWRA